MLESFIGRDLLREGLKLYLGSHRYGNAATSDLWEALTEISKKHGNLLDIKVCVEIYVKSRYLLTKLLY